MVANSSRASPDAAPHVTYVTLPIPCPRTGSGSVVVDSKGRNQRSASFRRTSLRNTAAHVKFLSLEPLLGPLRNLNFRGIDGAIVGGESGPGARPIDLAWVTDLRDQCLKARLSFFFKQWGGVHKKKAGWTLEGRTWDEMPTAAALAS